MNIFLIAISVAIFMALITLVIIMVALFKLLSVYKKQINIIEENKIIAEYEQHDNEAKDTTEHQQHDDNAKDATEHQQHIARLNNHKKSTYEYMVGDDGYYVKNDIGDFIIVSETVDGYDDTLMDK